jgi:hypothetical protein
MRSARLRFKSSLKWNSTSTMSSTLITRMSSQQLSADRLGLVCKISRDYRIWGRRAQNCHHLRAMQIQLARWAKLAPYSMNNPS